MVTVTIQLHWKSFHGSYWSRGSALQYRHLIPATVDRTSASAWLYKHQWIECQKNKPSTSKANVALNQIHVQLLGHLRFHAQKTGWRSGVRSCIMSGLPTHLVQELNVGTVCGA